MDLDIQVLIVDDSIISRRLIRMYLTRMGVTKVFEAENVNRGFHCLEREEIDLIISDWNMPGPSGLTFLKRVRSHEAFGKISFVMLTAEGLRSSVKEAVEAGVSAYVIKPLRYDDFRREIEGVLEMTRE